MTNSESPASEIDINADQIIVDRPIESEGQDALSRGPFADRLIRSLIRDDEIDSDGKLVRRATGYVVGLTGAWGSGKSSVLNLVAEKLGELPLVVVVRFNPWLFKGRDELLVAYFDALRVALGKSLGEGAAAVVDAVDRYEAAVAFAGRVAATAVDLHGGLGLANFTWSAIKRIRRAIPKRGAVSPDDERKSLEKKLCASNSAVVVLIDELDRVEDDEVRAVAQLIKAVGDIAGLSYLVAYDPPRVALALGRGDSLSERQASGESYLEKIVQLPVPLRSLVESDIEAMLEVALRQQHQSLPSKPSTHQTAVFAWLRQRIRTPRDIKRLVGTFAALHSMVEGEIDPLDVLAYAWIRIKNPRLASEMADRTDCFVIDPSEPEVTQRLRWQRAHGDKDPTPLVIIGEVAGGYEDLLNELFPRFSRKPQMDVEPDRIGLRRNLRRLLFLGDPPGSISRREIERVWRSTSKEKTRAALQKARVDGVLPEFMDRLLDWLPYLDPTHDLSFFLVFSAFQRRGDRWLAGAENVQDLTYRVVDTLIALAQRNDAAALRLAHLMQSLASHDDKILLPALLRKVAFFNRDVPDTHRLLPGLMASLLPGQLKRYREDVRVGRFLKHATDPSMLFLLRDEKQWDAKMKHLFTSQLHTAQGIASLAWLLVPPGYRINLDALAEFFDREAVSAAIDGLEGAGKFSTRQFAAVRGTIARLKLILGHDRPD